MHEILTTYVSSNWSSFSVFLVHIISLGAIQESLGADCSPC